MAEPCKLRNSINETITNKNQDENFCVFNVLCVFISLVTILADLTTDILVLAEYCKTAQLYWALGTFAFIITPNVLINVFSIKWFVIDEKCNVKHWITHGLLVGLLERYIVFLRKVFVCKNLESMKSNKLLSQRNDLSLLHFLYIFTGTVPQIILQMYAIIVLDENYHTKVFALSASIASLVWGCATYIYSITAFCNEHFQWKSLLLMLIWHFGMLMGRIPGILLFIVLFGVWTLVPLGLHWIVMTFWIVIQKTTFCPNKIEETLYNFVMGFVYCFCYINLREGQTRYRLMLFYTLIVTQNFGSLFLYVLISETDQQKKIWSIAATISIIIGTVIGMCAMIVYYRYFHLNGPIEWKNANGDIELNNKVVIPKTINNTGLKHVRSFKCSQRSPSNINSNDVSKPEHIQKVENENADKKFLLDHWIARSGTPTFTSAPIDNSCMDITNIEVYTVENTPQPHSAQFEDRNYYLCNNSNTPKKSFCSPTELALKLSSIENLESSIDEITSSNLQLHKRRAICFPDELTNMNLDVCHLVNGDFSKSKTDHSSEFSHDTDESNKKTSSDSIDMDLDLSFSDINSSDINTFNENIVQKLCLSALKNIKVGNQDADIENIQRIALDILKEMYAKKDKNKVGKTIENLASKSRDIDTPTEILSVHDYENICAVNIAREAWGLRSWNGYSDIENCLHDGSVVRDRRRDTLTSGSSEISSCISQELKNAILSAPSIPKKTHTYSNVFVKFDRGYQNDYANTIICQDDTFLAKPCMADISKDPNHLEPIMEELDDIGDIDLFSKKRLNSESSLVATIDEIRKSTVTNSPRNLYHRGEHLWDLQDSPQPTPPNKIDSNLKKALWKEPSKFVISNIMASLPEKENFNIERPKFNTTIKDLNTIKDSSSSYDISSFSNKSNKRHHKSNPSQLKIQCKSSEKSISAKSKQHDIKDISSKDIDFLWQLVSENTLQMSSSEDVSSNHVSTSLQSLIQNDKPLDNMSEAKTIINKKGVRSKPRRKFSILRERFEPRVRLYSDKEILYDSESMTHLSNSNTAEFKNRLDNNYICDTSIETQAKCNAAIDGINISSPVVSNLDMPKSIKDKQALFMKQVLSPPKFNTKLRHKV